MKLTETQLAAIDHHLRKDNWLLNEELIAEKYREVIEGLYSGRQSVRVSTQVTYEDGRKDTVTAGDRTSCVRVR